MKEATKKRLVKVVLVIFVIACILTLAVDFIILRLVKDIEITTEENQVVLYGEDFYDGTKASLHGKDFTKHLQVRGEVDTGHLGIYTLEYFCFGQTASRTVSVEDHEAPTFELEGDKVVFASKLEDYQNPGVKAFDNVDGDVTDKIQTSLTYLNNTNYYEIYTVSDATGNVAEIKRRITLSNPVQEEPTSEESLTAPAEPHVELPQEELAPQEPEPEPVSETELEPEPTKEPEVIPETPVTKVYLTFDDGPSRLTSQYLDVLKEYGVNATFFVLGFSESDKDWKIEIMKRAYNEGNIVALHGFSHEYSEIYSSIQNATENFYKENQLLMEALGIDVKIMRFPGGSSNTVSKQYCQGVMTEAARILVENGYNYIDWNVDSNDAGSDVGNSEAIFQNVMAGVITERANVILMHDSSNHQATLDALPRIIESLQEKGYQFDVITDETVNVRHNINN